MDIAETVNNAGDAINAKKSFQLYFVYNANKPGMHQKILDMTVNSSGFRDIGRTLKISPEAVSRTLKKSVKVNPYMLDIVESEQLSKLEAEINYSVEAVEMWSYVQNKGNQRWLWYVSEKRQV